VHHAKLPLTIRRGKVDADATIKKRNTGSVGLVNKLALGLLALLALAPLTLPGVALAETVRARIDGGVIVGDKADGIAVFKDLPFAAPPIGPLRWAPPAPAPAWRGDRSALSYGPGCLQAVNKNGAPNVGGASGPVSEDCLNLNVFAPVGASGAPVMVWIYGGGNVAGENSISAYDGSAFAHDGVILVSINYRLGALGFFAHPALTNAAASGEPIGNYALMDQIAALKWVQKNIKAFGGDAKRVTVFGESAGGIDITALMTIPAARGLFAQAIVESGAGWDKPVTLAAAEADGAALAAKLGAPNATLDQLRALPAEALIAVQGRADPIVDGRLMPEGISQAIARGHAADVPLIIGSNSFEASLLAAFHIPPEGYVAVQPEALRAAYAADPTPKAKAYAMFTDGVMGAPARWIAAKESGGAPSWLYYFSFRRAVYKDYLPGAPHASEIPFVFDSWDHIDPKLSRGPETAEDRALTDVMHGCWVAFAKTGAPKCPTPERWPAYTPARDQLMEFGESVGIRTNFRKPQLDAQEAAKADLISGK
jgi:para-nitrobenzyl esterase